VPLNPLDAPPPLLLEGLGLQSQRSAPLDAAQELQEPQFSHVSLLHANLLILSYNYRSSKYHVPVCVREENKLRNDGGG